MRAFARFFGVLCGAVVIAIAARYGFKTSDNDFDGYIWAFTYGSVTLGGLFGHSLAVRVWRHNRRIGGACHGCKRPCLGDQPFELARRDGGPRERTASRTHPGCRYCSGPSPRA